MRRRAVATALVALALLVHPGRAEGRASPPPPPQCPPICPIPPPPPPPTVLPTLPPGALPTPVPSVRATLSPTKVRRGQVMKLVVKALANDVVITAIQYRHARAKLAKGKPDAHGVFAKAWRIAKNAPLGSGSLKVTVMDGSATEYEDTLAFSVTK